MFTAPAPANRSATLLTHWERSRPVGSVPLAPELRTAFNEFVTEVLSDSQETNLVVADVEEVLRGASSLTIGRGEASGHNRAQQALQQAYQTAQAVGPVTASQGRIMLLVQSRPDTELEMDELTEITETMWRKAGTDWEMIFGHGIVPGLAAEIRLLFMLVPQD